MLSDAKIKSLRLEDGKRHADRDGLVLEIRPSGKKVFLSLPLPLPLNSRYFSK